MSKKAPWNKGFTDKDVAKLLLDARKLMNGKGKHWIKGRLRQNKKGIGTCYCSVGAIRAAAPGDGNKRLRAAAYKALALDVSNDPYHRSYYNPEFDEYGTRGRDVIIVWNDGITRTWEQIDARFRSVADKIKKGAKTK